MSAFDCVSLGHSGKSNRRLQSEKPCVTRLRAVRLFLELTLAFSLGIWPLIIWSGHLYMGFGLMIPVLMWCPGLAALATCRLCGRGFESLGLRCPQKKYIAIAYLLPIVYASIAYGSVYAGRFGGLNYQFVAVVVDEFGLPGLPAWGTIALFIISMATGGVLQSLSAAIGEEIGWRGFLVPELAHEMSFARVSLLSGTIWAAWHLPVLLFADYNSGTNRWYALTCSTVTMMSLSFIAAWLRMKSESVWPASVLHASHNIVVPGIFDNLTRNTGTTLWYTTQFGVALAVTSVFFAGYFWLRRSELYQQ